MIDRTNPPEGFEVISWGDVTHGDIVYLHGTKDGEQHAYGPHIVRSTANHMLEQVGWPFQMRFAHLPEELLRMVF